MVSVGKLGTPEEPVFIFDEGAPALFVDLITELEVDENDIVRISFGAMSKNGDGVEKAMIAVRIRMPKNMAWKFCRDLSSLER
ncbi:hypothetical protein SM11_chr2422 [Sinorhizobium meliloti SM11]|uniref:Uncharacterized protein n=1 Tax=Sinorhizobium meliloti (strain SM11) TaxID=707241 RepID=F7X490_SINMM|nr:MULTISPECIES: hypothetical protein [Sinorhizobium]AEH79676.1 hypothetical protein SM11_chr2422 [Sinorhizobium meliloti SM11]MDE4557463.1 hypothetical protein [Sinorhizobium meliloti SM11]MQX47123.1 hypothetical protein [Sinorhizobium medicae]WQO53265.1 hypothetical protein U8C36_06520 [Sinorhizobium medicae]WQO73962.1 hypothetical protein U8C31_06645 [Sinorhizobium medicae]